MHSGFCVSRLPVLPGARLGGDLPVTWQLHSCLVSARACFRDLLGSRGSASSRPTRGEHAPASPTTETSPMWTERFTHAHPMTDAWAAPRSDCCEGRRSAPHKQRRGLQRPCSPANTCGPPVPDSSDLRAEAVTHCAVSHAPDGKRC